MANVSMTEDDYKFIYFIKSLSPFNVRYPFNLLYPGLRETPFDGKLSEEVLQLMQDKINWTWVSFSQNLSEDFIRKFSHRIDFYYISRRKRLSEKFIKEFFNRLHFKFIPLCRLKINHEQSWQTFL